MTGLNSILKFYFYPRTVKVLSGTIISEEGSEICPGDVITVYSGGIKIYIAPEDILTLKGNETRNCFRSGEYGNTNIGDHIIKSIFVSNKEGLLDHHCRTTIYTNVSDLRKDQPRFVVANSDFMAFSNDEDKGMKKVKKGDELQILFDDVSILKAKVQGDVIILRDGNEQINVTASLTDDKIYHSNDIVAGEVNLPRVMSFADKETHGVFRSETGFSRLVIQDKFKTAFCLSKKVGKEIEQVSGGIGVIRNIRCFDVEMSDLQDVIVQVVKGSTMENVTPKFAVDIGTDKEGFKLYDLYLQFKGKWKKGYSYIQVKPQLPTDSPPSSDPDSMSDDGSYEEPLPKQDTQTREGIKTNGSTISGKKHTTLPCNPMNASATDITFKPSQRRNRSNISFSPTSDFIGRDPTLPDDEGPLFKESIVNDVPSHDPPLPDNEGPLFVEWSAKSGVSSFPYVYQKETENMQTTSYDGIDQPSTKVCPTSKPTTAVKPSPVAPTEKPDPPSAPPPLPPRSTTAQKSADFGDGKEDEGMIVLRDLSVSQLVEVLNGQNFKKLANVCEEHSIDGKFLMTLADEDLKDEPFYLNGFEIKKCNWLKEGNIPKV